MKSKISNEEITFCVASKGYQKFGKGCLEIIHYSERKDESKTWYVYNFCSNRRVIRQLIERIRELYNVVVISKNNIFDVNVYELDKKLTEEMKLNKK